MAKSALAKRAAPVIRVLLVEDNASDAFLLNDMLSMQDGPHYEILDVKTQSEAIVALSSGHEFDVCLLDLSLPDSSGFSALTDIQEKAPDMPVLILTGTNDIGLAKRAMGRGAQDYLLKDELEAAALSRSIDYARERKRVEKELFRRANFDALTGLANRSLFETRLKMALARSERMGTGLAVLFLDLDRFKPVNDTYGHEAGDDVLKTVAKRIKGVLRAYDTAARVGGDEFALLLENITLPRDAAMIAQKIIGSIVPSIPYRSQELNIGASIGIAFCDTPERAETLMQNADAAMYQAKKEGGNIYRFYAADVHYKAEARLCAENELRQALEQGQMRLYYQPYVTPGGDAILGVEALLRWLHPQRGLLCSGEFLGLAEDCRLMPEIAQWMFSTLKRDIATWSALSLLPLEIAFNISASQLEAPEITDWVAALAASSDDNFRFVAEIDSNALMSLSQSLFLTFVKLREMGIALHIDHFGQGPMSLQTLHTYPFSLLKLNLSTIEHMNSTPQADAIIRTAIELAHQLGMKAGAVGVETQSQMQMLKAQNCDVMQGYLIGHPMSAEQLPKWLTGRHLPV